MNTNPDDWWLRRRHPPVSLGDTWSSGGKAYRAWMGANPGRNAPARSGAARDWPPNPRAVRSVRTRRRARLGRLLGLAAAGCAAVVSLAPLAWAGRLDPCAAAEVALIDEAVGHGSRFEASKSRVANWIGLDGKLMSRGRVGRQIAFEGHPGWPSFAGCTALFWRVRSENASLDGVTPVLTRALSARR